MVAQVDKNFLKARPSKLWSRLLAYALFEGRPLTTKGRWINPLVFAGYRLWGALPLKNRVENPVFILGVGRSGTTILGTILALHRDVGYLNEPKALWQAALGDDDLIGSYSTKPGRFKMSATDASGRAARRLRRYYSAFLGLSGNRRVVDKYPELLFRSGMIDAIFPGARKIVLLRNGMDTCQSIEQWSGRNGRVDNDWWGRNRQKWHLLVDELVTPDPYLKDALPDIRKFERHVDMAAVEWVVTMREVLRLQVQESDGFLFVRYEELAAHPRKVMQEILRFSGLSMDETMLDYAQSSLKPRPPYPEPDLHPAITGVFEETMQQLGYASRCGT